MVRGSVGVVSVIACICALAGAGGASDKEVVSKVKNQGQDQSVRQLAEGFAKPENPYRALPMCSFDYAHIDEHVRAAREAGWGGMHIQFSDWGPGYARDEAAWRQVTDAVKACKANGLPVWIYDERGYPSGKAGFLVLQDHPELEAQGLYYDHKDVSLTSAETVDWILPEGKPYYVAAYRLDMGINRLTGAPVDLTGKAQNGILKADLGPGDWRLMAYVQAPLFKGTHAQILGERYINVMDPRAVRRFLDVTHEQYYAHCGDEFGKTIKAFFTDEPSLMGGYLVDEIQQYPALSWYDGLPAAFRKAHGYDIRDTLPALFCNAGPDTVRMRCDYYSTVSRLTADNYFGQIRRWCKAHNVISTGHCVWEESLLYHANFYGSIMDSLAELDWPGIDLLGCTYGCPSGSRTEGGPVTPKLISSTAHLYGKERTITESFCFVTKETPPQDMLSEVAWEWVLGINTLTTLSMQQEHTPEVQRQLNEYTGRLSYMLTRGRFVADVAVVYPIASVWADFTPTNHPVWDFDRNPKAEVVDACWQAVSRSLLGCQRDFDYIDEASILKSKAATGALKVGQCRYSILVLPNVTTLKYSALQRMAEFVESGGTVVVCGEGPTHREDAGSAEEFTSLAKDLFGGAHNDRVIHVDGPKSLPEAMSLIGGADVRAGSGKADVYYQHRSLRDGDVYFLQNNSTKETTDEFTFRATGRAQVWNPLTAEMTPSEAKRTGKNTTVSVSLPARNGLFVVFDRAR